MKIAEYSLRSNLTYLIRETWKLDKGIFPIFLIYTVCSSVTPLISVVIPSVIVKQLLDGQEMKRIVFNLALLLGVGCLMHVTAQLCHKYYWPRIIRVRLQFILNMNIKNMQMDYRDTESPDVQDMIQRARIAISTNSTGIEGVLNQLFVLASAIITFLGLAAIISTLSVWVTLFLGVTVLGGYFLSLKTNKKNHDLDTKMSPDNREITYLEQRSQLTGPAKDIRLYHMADWLKSCYWDCVANKLKWTEKKAANNGWMNLWMAFMDLVRDGAVYAYLIYEVVAASLSVSNLTLYFITVMNFSQKLNEVADSLADIKRQSLYVSDYRAFMDYKAPYEKQPVEQNAANTQTPVTVTFNNVSFRYPGSQDYVLRKLSCTIQGGKRTALVGENGAGKSTFVNLLCGLYEPCEGEILINGTDCRHYEKEEYYRLLSVVFQDMELYAFRVGENISLSSKEAVDKDRLVRSIRQAGLWEKCEALPQKLETNVLKKFDKEGVEFSGGEAQRLYLARALYKDAPLMILDEPTAALDPLAEKRLYESFDEITKGKTALYISHRLASTRFCDTIIFLREGSISEQGTHEELMERDGAYAALYKIQAQYYVG